MTWELWRNKDLTLSEKAIFIEISNLSMLDNGCVASNAHFSQLMGIKKEAVSRLISSLESKGFISTKILPGSRNFSRVITINKMLTQPLTKCLETKDNKTSNAPKEAFEAFENLWKGYTLTFLKRQNRQGGSKKKAKEKYIALRSKYSHDAVEEFVSDHASQKIGHKDLERLLNIDLVQQYFEDKNNYGGQDEELIFA